MREWMLRTHGRAGEKGSLLALAILAGLMLTAAVALANGANFDSSYKIGPRFANTNDIITYTIVAVNSGSLVNNVVLSDPLPVATTFLACSYQKSGDYVPSHPCGQLPLLWQETFSTGTRITTYLRLRVDAGTMQWPLVNCAYLTWDGSQKQMCFTTTVNPRRLYLPIIMRRFTPQPDLRVTSLTVQPPNPTAGQPVVINVVVRNVGELPAGPFWVDFYDNPATPPTAANQIWNFLCSGPLNDCYGIAWYVSGGLAPGSAITLTSLSGYQPSQTHWTGSFVHSGDHTLYAFADAWNWGVWYGAVLERNENLDNRYGPVYVSVAVRGEGEPLQTGEEEVYIPWRPNRP